MYFVVPVLLYDGKGQAEALACPGAVESCQQQRLTALLPRAGRQQCWQQCWQAAVLAALLPALLPALLAARGICRYSDTAAASISVQRAGTVPACSTHGRAAVPLLLQATLQHC